MQTQQKRTANELCYPLAIATVDIGGTKIANGLVVYTKENEQPLVRRATTLPSLAYRGGAAVLDDVVSVVRKLLADDERATVEGTRVPIVAISVATAGVPDPETGTMIFASDTMPNWDGQPVKSRLVAEFGLPVQMLNDVQAYALGEARWGAARGTNSCLAVAPGTGLGGGIVINGKLVRGAHGAAGHIGHTMHAAAAGVLCTCGHLGHAEGITSGTALTARYQGKELHDKLDKNLMGDVISKRAAAGEKRAIEVLRDAGFALGQSIGSWCNTLDPDCVILGGSVAKAGPVWRNAVDAGYASQAILPLQNTPIISAALGEDAPLVGAAEDALDMLRG